MPLQRGHRDRRPSRRPQPVQQRSPPGLHCLQPRHCHPSQPIPPRPACRPKAATRMTVLARCPIWVTCSFVLWPACQRQRWVGSRRLGNAWMQLMSLRFSGFREVCWPSRGRRWWSGQALRRSPVTWPRMRRTFGQRLRLRGHVWRPHSAPRCRRAMRLVPRGEAALAPLRTRRGWQWCTGGPGLSSEWAWRGHHDRGKPGMEWRISSPQRRRSDPAGQRIHARNGEPLSRRRTTQESVDPKTWQVGVGPLPPGK
mmetsp:Transcript_118688/g.272353  ORF Transcript_118688/g.272353 Transcript_118688/m.272353 type:complete len:255 (+) Transcript_118688:838-1602(+)